MASDVVVVPAGPFLRVALEGGVDLDGVKRLVHRLALASADHPDRPVLVDFRGIADDSPSRQIGSTELAQVMAEMLQTGLGVTSKVAVLRRPLPGEFDRGRFFEELATDRGRELAVFHDHESAFAWLFGDGDPV